ncbi:hypothetical protein [Sphingobium sp. B11D3D]|uniref:hypothetical protein n=1 Tax=Sphingobium sp. B11D3D TaxID=2940576 RepID=UPI0022259810|nr:hypothetical protein [Sphingobium sp. B11D3D]MCW2368824.1 hypothetical protein [Sphingobium sp. B11D3D]
MKALTPQELEELRADCASLGLSEDRLTAVIHLLDNIAVSIVDQQFGWHPVQLSLAQRANYASKRAENHASLRLSGDAGPVDLDCDEGAINTMRSPEGRPAP